MVPSNQSLLTSAFLTTTAHVARRLGCSFDPESDSGRKVVKLVIEKIIERVAEASKKKDSDGAPSPKGTLAAEMRGGYDGASDDDTAGSSTDSPATKFARQIPVLHLKLESRACGLLAAWVRDTVILVDALGRAEDM